MSLYHGICSSLLHSHHIIVDIVLNCFVLSLLLCSVSSLAGLRLLDFSARAIKAHPKVLQFYKQFTRNSNANNNNNNNYDQNDYNDNTSNIPVDPKQQLHEVLTEYYNQVPYKVQYASSARSVCKQCSQVSR